MPLAAQFVLLPRLNSPDRHQIRLLLLLIYLLFQYTFALARAFCNFVRLKKKVKN